jgi:transglutaminase-like putative cysteine protease
MIFEVNHKTVYHYTAPVAQAHHLVHLAPRPHPRQRVIRHTLLVEPTPASRNDFVDYFGNPAATVAIESSHSELLIHSRSVIEVAPPEPVNLNASEPWDRIAAQLAPANKPYDMQVVQYLIPSHFTDINEELIEFARPFFKPGRPVLECARAVMDRIHTEFAYDNAATDVATTIADLLKIRRGVCQDFAHLLIGALRAFCLPARYVSGYLLTRPPAGRERLAGADASHAWVSVWSPGIGWVDFDPTNNVISGEEHITIAYGRDFQDVSPVTGVLLGGGAHQVEVAVDVVPALTVQAEAPFSVI